MTKNAKYISIYPHPFSRISYKWGNLFVRLVKVLLIIFLSYSGGISLAQTTVEFGADGRLKFEQEDAEVGKDILMDIELSNIEEIFVLYQYVNPKSFKFNQQVSLSHGKLAEKDGDGKFVIPYKKDALVIYNIIKDENRFYNFYDPDIAVTFEALLSDLLENFRTNSNRSENPTNSIITEFKRKYIKLFPQVDTLSKFFTGLEKLLQEEITSKFDYEQESALRNRLVRLDKQVALKAIISKSKSKEIAKEITEKFTLRNLINPSDVSRFKQGLRNLGTQIRNKEDKTTQKEYFENLIKKLVLINASEFSAQKVIEYTDKIIEIKEAISLIDQEIGNEKVVLRELIPEPYANYMDERSLINGYNELFNIEFVLLRMGYFDLNPDYVLYNYWDKSKAFNAGEKKIYERKISSPVFKDLTIDSKLRIQINNVVVNTAEDVIYNITITEGEKIDLETSDKIRPTVADDQVDVIASNIDNYALEVGGAGPPRKIDFTFNVKNTFTDEFKDHPLFTQADIQPTVTIEATGLVAKESVYEEKNGVYVIEDGGKQQYDYKKVEIFKEKIGYVSPGYRFNLTSGFALSSAPSYSYSVIKSSFNSEKYILKEEFKPYDLQLRPIVSFDLYFRKFYVRPHKSYVPNLSISVPIPVGSQNELDAIYVGTACEPIKYIQFKVGAQFGAVKKIDSSDIQNFNSSSTTIPELNDSKFYCFPFIAISLNLNILRLIKF